MDCREYEALIRSHRYFKLMTDCEICTMRLKIRVSNLQYEISIMMIVCFGVADSVQYIYISTICATSFLILQHPSDKVESCSKILSIPRHGNPILLPIP